MEGGGGGGGRGEGGGGGVGGGGEGEGLNTDITYNTSAYYQHIKQRIIYRNLNM